MGDESQKQRAAEAALAWIEEGSLVGVGTGSTVNHFIDALAAGRTRVEAAVSSSEATTRRLKDAGIQVVDLNAAGPLDVYVDGADEATRHLQLVKGGGGALTREKVIAQAARTFVCIADASKLVEVLGSFPLPVEVIPMARSLVARELVNAGGQPVWREDFVTDNGNWILDVHNLDITDPAALERELNQVPGVVTVGLFAIRPADVLLLGGEDGVKQLER